MAATFGLEDWTAMGAETLKGRLITLADRRAYREIADLVKKELNGNDEKCDSLYAQAIRFQTDDDIEASIAVLRGILRVQPSFKAAAITLSELVEDFSLVEAIGVVEGARKQHNHDSDLLLRRSQLYDYAGYPHYAYITLKSLEHPDESIAVARASLRRRLRRRPPFSIWVRDRLRGSGLHLFDDEVVDVATSTLQHEVDSYELNVIVARLRVLLESLRRQGGWVRLTLQAFNWRFVVIFALAFFGLVAGTRGTAYDGLSSARSTLIYGGFATLSTVVLLLAIRHIRGKSLPLFGAYILALCLVSYVVARRPTQVLDGVLLTNIGPMAGTIYLWTFAIYETVRVLVLGKVALARYRRLCIAHFYYNLAWSLYATELYDFRMSPDIRIYLANRLENIANDVRTILRQYGAGSDVANRSWWQGRIDGTYISILELKRWLLIPKVDTREQLRMKLLDIFHIVDSGNLDGLPWTQPTREHTTARQRIAAVGRTLLAVALVVASAIALDFALGLDRVLLRWSAVVGFAWLVISGLRLYDLDLDEKIDTFRRFIEAPRNMKGF